MRFTAGELAKMLGVSARTVRFYDEKELLNPCGYSEAGYRIYDEDSVVRLQKILMLKYMDFSLEQISDMMKNDSSDKRKSLDEQEQFLIDKRDAADFSYPVAGFDLIMVNHVLFYLERENRLQLYKTIKSLLKEDGRFSCTLLGQTHMKQIHDLVTENYPEVKFPFMNFDFFLENAKEEIESTFTVTSVEEQDNNLMVPDEEMVYNYITSFSEDCKQAASRDKDNLIEKIREKMDENGYMYIHKSGGVVMCKA